MYGIVLLAIHPVGTKQEKTLWPIGSGLESLVIKLIEDKSPVATGI